jgi:hypothetical protein
MNSLTRRRENLTNAAIQLQAARGGQALVESARGTNQLVATAKQYANVAHGNHLAGRVFENLHVTTANVDAAL